MILKVINFHYFRFQTSYSNGDLTVTTHRIYWSSKVQPEIVLELSLVVLVEEESSGGFMKSEKLVLHLSLPPPSKYSCTLS